MNLDQHFEHQGALESLQRRRNAIAAKAVAHRAALPSAVRLECEAYLLEEKAYRERWDPVFEAILRDAEQPGASR